MRPFSIITIILFFSSIEVEAKKEKKLKGDVQENKLQPKTRPMSPLPAPAVLKPKIVMNGPRPAPHDKNKRLPNPDRPLLKTPRRPIKLKTKAPNVQVVPTRPIKLQIKAPSVQVPTRPIKLKPKVPTVQEVKATTKIDPTPTAPGDSPTSPVLTPTQTCRLCSTTYRVPKPRLILLDKKCSEWNRQQYSSPDCRSIQATIGAACQCESPPKPRCNVCEDGDYIWENNPNYNTFTDDFCVKMIFKMSQRYEFCVGNREHVARMCCTKNWKDEKEEEEDDDEREKKKTKSYRYKKYKDNSKYDKAPSPIKSDNRKNEKSYDIELPRPTRRTYPPTKYPTYSPTYYPTYYYYYTYPPTISPSPKPVKQEPVIDYYDYYYYDDYYNDDNI